MATVDYIDEFGHEHGPGGLPVLPPHKNPGLEIVYVRHGHLVWHCDGRAEIVPPESIFFTLPWQEHGSMLDFEPGHEWFFVVIKLRLKNSLRRENFAFPADFNFDIATTQSIAKHLSQSKQHAWAATPMIAFLLPALLQELTSPTRYHAIRTRQLSSQLVVELAEVIHSKHHSVTSPTTHRRKIGALIEELNNRFDHPWRCGEMAQHVGLHRTQFVSVFHHCTGDSPKRFLHRLRIEKSREMLRTTNRSITHIAMDCGFSSSQHFANVFRRFTGISARAYRQRKQVDIHLPRRVRAQ